MSDHTESDQTITMDRSCHYAKGFEEILEASLTDDLSCLYCAHYVSLDHDQFKQHLLRVHFNFTYSFMLHDKLIWILPCRRRCITRIRQGNRSHFHCPVCGNTYGRKPALVHHLDTWKGNCQAKSGLHGTVKRAKPSQNLRSKIFADDDIDIKPLPALTFEGMQASELIASTQFQDARETMSFNGGNPNSSYTVVVENEEQTSDDETTFTQGKLKKMSEEMIQEQLQKSQRMLHDAERNMRRQWQTTQPLTTFDEADTAELFGKTVASRIRSLDRKKQADAMQKIMQALFDIEYSDIT